MPLNRHPNVDAPDDVYQLFIEAHLGLSEAQSHRLNARIILTLANHIGDFATIKDAIDVARSSDAWPSVDGVARPPK